MALIRDLSKAQLAFQVAGLEVDLFEVNRYRGTEGLCQLYRFEIELSSTAEKVAFDTIVGKPAVLSINTDYGERWFHGVVGRFEITGETTGQTYFRAELVPSVWLLTHRYNSRIFQQKTVPDIISEVLTRGGIASDRFNLGLLKRGYEPREYCVQYRETDYNFICRLMEEEGIRWYFQQSQEAHVLILEDGPASTYAPIEGDPALPYHPPTGMNVGQEHVFRFRLSQAVRPGAVALNDFTFKNPKLDLHTAGDCGRDPGLEFFDYPGEYLEQGRGQALASLRAEEFEAGRTLGVGRSNSPRLAPGRKFDLIEHPAGLNSSYLITAVTHQGKQAVTRTTTGGNGRSGLLDARLHQSLIAARQHENTAIRELAEALLQIISRFQTGDSTAPRALTHWLYHAGQVSRDLASIAGACGANPLMVLAIPNLLEGLARLNMVEPDAPIYECAFECIPASVSYRPARVTPWPVMRGTQTARVVGPQGEEIHTDEYGRVKVQFNWDRQGKFDDHSSCWIRVSQGFAGGNYGIMFLPRVGQEVIVDFLEGDPDQPIITGRVYNADHMPPYELPKEKTKSVIKSRSSKGGGGTNEIRFEDLKDKEQILIYAQKDLHVRAKNDRVTTIENNDHFLVKKERREEIGANHSVKVGGSEAISVAQSRSVVVTGDVVEDFKANHQEKSALTYSLQATNIKLEGSAEIELKCGGSSIVLTPAAIFIVGGPLVNINSGSGPPVAPVAANAASPAAPLEADKVEPGKDTAYAQGEQLAPGTVGPDLAGHEFEAEQGKEEKTSWIDLELVDAEDKPVPGEPYEIVTPSGRILRGNLDVNGRAHITGIDPGTCQISFPNRDQREWTRA